MRLLKNVIKYHLLNNNQLEVFAKGYNGNNEKSTPKNKVILFIDRYRL
jgi:hypothetical protein